MKFTELSAYELPGGTVTRWTPVTDAEPTGWDTDARPLTYEHEDHITRAGVNCTAEMHESSWLGAVFEIDRAFDPDAMRRALLAWTRRHEAFRTTVTLSADTCGGVRQVRRTRSADAVSICSESAGRIESDAVRDVLISMFDRALSPLDWPHCMAATISDTDQSGSGSESFYMVFAADHSVMDAYSMFLSINELRQFYDAELENRAPTPSPIGSHVDFSASSRAAGETLTVDHPGIQRWRRFLDASGGRFPDLGLPLSEPLAAVDGPRDTDDRQRGWAGFVATADQVATLTALSRAAGHSTQTAVIAALALAHQELTGDPLLRAAMPMHTRHETQFVESVGWYVGIGPLEVDLAQAETIADVLAASAAGIGEAKRLSRLPYPRVAQLLGTHAEPEFVVSYLDLRFVPGATDWPGWRAQTLRGATRSESEVYLWVARTPTGMTVSTRYPGNEVAAANVRRLITTACTIVDAVIDAGAPMRDRSAPLPATSGHDERQPA
ncbi:condensation domain-containing protein [Gordonia insulae]|uniref:Acyltransferase papA3 n=1 Tax=Gordonia insulae TaxID=2420509 RepID=A0A3G8JLC1_9ACTN|nr:condensation domain-containing protein [Gordonia insulae]AZG45239.1 Acyltransferase papA3 [Gordonia insulae]